MDDIDISHYSIADSYSLNSPVLEPPPLPRTARRTSSFIPASHPISRDLRRRTATCNSTTNLRLSIPSVPATVLGSPDPAQAVQARRQLVQFEKQPGSPVNWARPFSSQAPSSYRPAMQIHASARPGSTSSNSDDDLPLTPQQAYLPPGAAAPDRWPGAKAIGLGVRGVSFDSESDESTSSSPPTTPTRLLFVSESLDALSCPTTLEELSRLRKAAAELDFESNKLRRHKGRDPATIPRRLPRKAVPVATEADLTVVAVAPSPRRPAVRHSLVIASPPDFTAAAPEKTPRDQLALLRPSLTPPMAARRSVSMLPPMPSRTSLTPPPPLPVTEVATPRRPFYALGQGAMSSIEFTRGADAETDELRMGRRFVSQTASASASAPNMPSLTSLRQSVESSSSSSSAASEPKELESSPHFVDSAFGLDQPDEVVAPAVTRASPTAPGPPVLQPEEAIPDVILRRAQQAGEFDSERERKAPAQALARAQVQEFDTQSVSISIKHKPSSFLGKHRKLKKLWGKD